MSLLRRNFGLDFDRRRDFILIWHDYIYSLVWVVFEAVYLFFVCLNFVDFFFSYLFLFEIEGGFDLCARQFVHFFRIHVV